MHTIGYDNNVSPYSRNVTTRLYTCTCTGMQVCGHIPAHRCSVYIILYMYTLIIPLCDCLLQEGISPLHVASQQGHTGIVQVLLDHGAQPNILTKVAIQYRHAVYDHIPAVCM